MAVLFIGMATDNLVPMPDPKLQGMTVRLQDLDGSNSTRTASGKMVRDRIVGGADAKRKIEIEWPAMDTASISMILQAISEPFFILKYPDPYIGDWRTAVFYAGDRTAPIYNGATPDKILWEGLEVNFIER